jgi:hypothetical protein
MSFREKRAVVSLLALWIAGIGFALVLWRYPPPNAIAGFLALFAALVLLMLIITVSQLALVIAVGLREATRPSDERERLVQLSSQRNAGWVGTAGLWAIPWFMINPTPRLAVACAALGLFLLGQMVMYGSELYYYRRGV